MLDADVQFYDEDTTVPPLFHFAEPAGDFDFDTDDEITDNFEFEDADEEYTDSGRSEDSEESEEESEQELDDSEPEEF